MAEEGGASGLCCLECEEDPHHGRHQIHWGFLVQDPCQGRSPGVCSISSMALTLCKLVVSWLAIVESMSIRFAGDFVHQGEGTHHPAIARGVRSGLCRFQVQGKFLIHRSQHRTKIFGSRYSCLHSMNAS